MLGGLANQVQVLEKVKYKGSVPGENSNNTRAFEVISKEPRKAEPKAEPGKPKIEVIGEMKPKVGKAVCKVFAFLCSFLLSLYIVSPLRLQDVF